MPFEDWMWAIWLGIMIIMVIVECMGTEVKNMMHVVIAMSINE